MSKTALHRASLNCSVRFLGTILAQIFFIPNFSVSIKRTTIKNGFLVHVHSISNHYDCQSAIRSNKFSYLCCVVTSPCCWWSSAALLIFNKGFAFRNILCQRRACALDIASSKKGCWSSPCVVVAIVIECNTKKKNGIPQRDVLCFHFHDKVHKHLLTCYALTSLWATAKPCGLHYCQYS